MNKLSSELGVTVGDHLFEDLDYEDDAVLIVDSEEQTIPVLKTDMG